ncbi:ferredoxin [Nocardia jinanensis]|uniref:Ferredoxin n=1 Tax=Nocardia jinanensis TaxID=382504 RepID=A0A917VSB7_9NOCA|nr:ferredoxin [Nocardia jinanensis]GGL13773.1 ferredoxin [Nocardia jinanensis]
MKVSIDSKACVGHGLCFMNAPDVFVYDDDGFGQVAGDGSVDESQREQARAGAYACPERAVTVVE